jgi:hypothetical protein
MTDKELYRLGIIQRVFDRALLQRDAADILKLSVRQVQRLVRLPDRWRNRICIFPPWTSCKQPDR